MKFDYLVSPLMFLKRIISSKWVDTRDKSTTYAIRLQSLNYLYVVFLGKRSVALAECEKKIVDKFNFN